MIHVLDDRGSCSDHNIVQYALGNEAVRPLEINVCMYVVMYYVCVYVCIMCVCVCIYIYMGVGVAQWLRHCATNWKVAGSIPAGVIGIFH
jgi:ABC-type transport system involved in Fe-S cluster assembly fused permease/ATPase subunit